MWRIIGAHEGEQMYRELCHDEAKLALLGNLRALLMRLVQGEDRNEHLFEVLRDGLTFLSGNDLSHEELSNTECLLVMRILYALGYFPASPAYLPYLHNSRIEKKLLIALPSQKKSILRAINHSLNETNL